MFNKLAGMTGTAKTEEEEDRDIYNMDVGLFRINKERSSAGIWEDSVYLK